MPFSPVAEAIAQQIIGNNVKQHAWGMTCAPFVMRLQYHSGARQGLQQIKAATLVGYGEDEGPGLVQERLTVLEEAEQIRRVLDDV
jgi:hypothetical protein